ncbi:MAG: sensor histidine kinase [Thermodesulfobacteriota bacterium]
MALRMEETADELPMIQGDHDRLLQVLLNLLSNAIKFTDQGEVAVSVGTDHGNNLVVRVRDSGVGIAGEDLEKIFCHFHQGANLDTLTDKPKGTGLGLAICRQIIDHHGGRIWAESRVGQGSTFSFSLPLRRGATEESETADPTRGSA